ncbi:hypothetical protein CLI64_23365 [Nostoc sp. CENA543]|uniref:hypothetical protein n=1 Tax=Nostoc sp. CENA543 TaxID=1869241 RepID=UPI000CA3734D|nr:hypothetical protein [Nostoc sp. CENA543]AUT03110.1 hypothetical protein CLI64_23365 [Nostoc sp. CENA543]
MKLITIFTNRRWRLRIFAVATSLIATLLLTQVVTPSQTLTRDKYLWPFAPTSIWNMPIGSGARYKPAYIQKAYWAGADTIHLYKLKASDPLRSVYAPGSWEVRCSGTRKTTISVLPVPDSLIVPDTVDTSTPNNSSAFLMPDGRTIQQLNPLARCQKSGPVYGYAHSKPVDIYGDGITGSHGGSGLSAIGGTIRKGELIGSQPIRHALKVLLDSKKYYYYSQSIPGYRWPADRADQVAPTDYKGRNPALVMGSLLAIPSWVTEASLNLQTPAAKKLFYALQNYGAYVVDNAGWDCHYIAVEKGVNEEFKQIYGYSMVGKDGRFYEDFMRLFQALYIVDNNSPISIGGGGVRRVALAPPIGN